MSVFARVRKAIDAPARALRGYEEDRAAAQDARWNAIRRLHDEARRAAHGMMHGATPQIRDLETATYVGAVDRLVEALTAYRAEGNDLPKGPL